MKSIKWWIILFNLLLILAYFNWSINAKEQMIKNGQLILLELAPDDPRSLMQGDYMSLRYKMAQGVKTDSIEKLGYFVVTLDPAGVANRVRIQSDITPLQSSEKLIRYHLVDQWNLNIGAESFFFEEGQGEKYDKAKYGGIKVDGDGNSVLVGLYDEQKRRIE